jgi:ElaB/YqjD/DUF883 family membrane-anchored ribosome-binding protein
MHKAGTSLPDRRFNRVRITIMSASTTPHESVDDWQSRAGEYAEWGRDIASEWGESVEGQIRAQPLAAVLIAGGVGFLLGWFSTRRS